MRLTDRRFPSPQDFTHLMSGPMFICLWMLQIQKITWQLLNNYWLKEIIQFSNWQGELKLEQV